MNKIDIIDTGVIFSILSIIIGLVVSTISGNNIFFFLSFIPLVIVMIVDDWLE